MTEVESNRHAGYPRDTRAGYPPTKSAVTPSSISGANGSTHQPRHGSAFVDDEKLAAAWCQLRHGDPRLSDEARAAQKGMSDLIGRTWREEREMGRDEKRLLARYSKTLDAADAEMVAAYRQCTQCQGTT